jgi:hypothetical protein
MEARRYTKRWPLDEVEACEEGSGGVDFNDIEILGVISWMYNG